MSRLSTCFDRLRQEGRTALVAYIVAGDYHLELCVPLMRALVDYGVDVIELGYPFSDPAAEGPVIQAGHERALAAGTQLPGVLQAVATFRRFDKQTPVVLMGYLNPVEQLGYERFATDASRAGADGVLVVDLPMDDARDLSVQFAGHGLDLILLLAPTTSAERSLEIGACTRGYLYCVALKGLTGANSLEVKSVQEQVEKLKLQTQTPVCVGFGIKTPKQAMQIAQFADGVVIGSALVDKIGSMAGSTHPPEHLTQALGTLLRPLRRALDTVAS